MSMPADAMELRPYMRALHEFLSRMGFFSDIST